MTPRARIALFFVAAAVLFTAPLFTKDLWTPDEPRYAEVSREMMVSGDYLVPRLNGNHYDEKPPLQFWFIALASYPAGGVNGLTARVPTVISAVVVLWLTFLLARRMYDDQTALWSVFVLATTFRFWWLAHVGQLDMLLTACTTLSLYAIWRWHETASARWFIVYYTGIALGLLTKGPPALVVAALGALAFRWRDQRGKQLAFWAGIPLTLVPVLIWFLLAHSGRSSGVSGELEATVSRQIVGRLFDGLSHAEPPWYYLENLPLDLFPWFFFLPWVVYFVWRERREGPAMRLLLSWIVPALVFFHLAAGKRELYLLPLYPAYSVLAARSLIALVDEGRVRWLRSTTFIWGALTLIGTSAPFVVQWTSYGDDHTGAMWLMAGVAALCAAWTLYILRRRDWHRWPTTLAVQCGILLVAFAAAVLPAINVYKSARSYCAPVRALVEAGPVSVYSLVVTRHEHMFYSRTTHKVLLEHPAVSVFGPADNVDAQHEAERVQRKLDAACTAIPVGDLMHPTEAERASLRAAVFDALHASYLDDDQAGAYEREVDAELLPLVDAVPGGTPVAVYVRREDWKWIVAFIDKPLALTVVRDERVSSRNMLLLANEPARRTLQG